MTDYLGGYPAAAMPGNDMFFVQMMGQQPMSIAQLQQMAISGQLKGESMVAPASNPQGWMPAKAIPGLFSDKDWLTAVIVTWLLGTLGIDRFLLGYTGLGVLKLLTVGGCGIWALIDAILITLRKLPDSDGRPLA